MLPTTTQFLSNGVGVLRHSRALCSLLLSPQLPIPTTQHSTISADAHRSRPRIGSVCNSNNFPRAYRMCWRMIRATTLLTGCDPLHYPSALFGIPSAEHDLSRTRHQTPSKYDVTALESYSFVHHAPLSDSRCSGQLADRWSG